MWSSLQGTLIIFYSYPQYSPTNFNLSRATSPNIFFLLWYAPITLNLTPLASLLLGVFLHQYQSFCILCSMLVGNMVLERTCLCYWVWLRILLNNICCKRLYMPFVPWPSSMFGSCSTKASFILPFTLKRRERNTT